jgi:hypothetical protein
MERKENCTVLRPGKEIRWISSLHISVEVLHFPLHPTSLQLCSYSVHRNVGGDNHMIILASDKHFGLVETRRGWRIIQQVDYYYCSDSKMALENGVC